MSATVEQQKYAVEHFIRWLSHENELGHEPAEIEIERVFDFEGESFVILKFKAEKDKEWLFGQCGGFVPGRLEDSGLTWSEFEPYDEAIVVEKCKGYTSMLREKGKGDPVIVTQKMLEAKKWDEAIKFIDENIDNYRFPREIDGKKVYQFYDVDDFIYYGSISNNEDCEFRIGRELRLLSNKLYAQVELCDPKALETADEMLKVAPYYLPVLLERCEYFKRAKDYAACRQALNEMYPYIWNARDFARYMRSFAWLSIEEKDIEAAVHYLSWSVLYDGSEQSFKYVDGELNYIKNQFGFDDIPRPSYKTTFDYFMKRKLNVFPTPANRTFCMRLYDHYLRNQESQKQRLEEARENLINLTMALGCSKTDVKIVEVNVLTPNWYEVSFDYGCAAQIPKSLIGYTPKEGNIFEYRSESENGLKIEIKPFSNFEDDDMYKNMVEGKLLLLDNLQHDVKVDDVLLQSGETIKRGSYIVGDNAVEVYYFKINEKLLGELIASYPIGSDHENEVLTILNTWEKRI